MSSAVRVMAVGLRRSIVVVGSLFEGGIGGWVCVLARLIGDGFYVLVFGLIR